MATLTAPILARAGRQDASAALKSLESKAGGRLGVCFLDTPDRPHCRQQARRALCHVLHVRPGACRLDSA